MSFRSVSVVASAGRSWGVWISLFLLGGCAHPVSRPSGGAEWQDRGQWVSPLKKVRVTSAYGKRGGEFHAGVDLRAPLGTPVYAVKSGLVLYAGSAVRGYGQMIVLRHPHQLNTVYAHNSKVLVKRGQKVLRGQKIAESGSSGRARGPHLHFEVRQGSKPLNPAVYLAERG